MSDLRPGEHVDITIKGARVVNRYPRTIHHGEDAEHAYILVADITDGTDVLGSYYYEITDAGRNVLDGVA